MAYAIRPIHSSSKTGHSGGDWCWRGQLHESSSHGRESVWAPADAGVFFWRAALLVQRLPQPAPSL